VDTIKKITLNVTGQDTGHLYSGSFSIETVINRRAHFTADEKRRQLIGSNPLGASPSIMGESYMLAQLFVRIVEAPKWWTDSDNGLDLLDANVIGELYRLVDLKVNERNSAVVEQGKQAVDKLGKSAKKIIATEEGADAEG
jgi:hypothetical protein